ncbi:hypothetical protein B0T10DRAFT_464504 [Thelonectria olida]|uniref:Uncharacterized protein n=1 Tax=Thelonectria olida TaxID=1576542 RepID=A0A9P8VU94_9HYPO|nr:hypothetical protein B0T10DRAFT_464504 [Thelonectria olida]
MFQHGATERCKAFFRRFLVVFLGAALLSQLVLLPARADGFSISSVAESVSGEAFYASPLKRDTSSHRTNRIERHFSDAGSHKLLARVLDPRLVTEGQRFICSLNSRDYPDPSPWLNSNSIKDYEEGWSSTNPAPNEEALNTLQPWLAANELSAALAEYQTFQTRNSRNKKGLDTTKAWTNAAMKNIFNVAEGTIIVEDVLSPREAPTSNWAMFQMQLQIYGGITEEEAPDYEIDVPPSQDASGYEIPSLSKWSDIAYLQLLLAADGNENQVRGVRRIIQFHTQIREALATVSESLDSVNIDSNGVAVDFLASTDACRALFKTPNGNGGYFLFAQHPQQMGSKTLERISVFTSNRNQRDADPVNGEDTSVWYYMVAHFVDLP